jgi:hypothetical protein
VTAVYSLTFVSGCKFTAYTSNWFMAHIIAGVGLLVVHCYMWFFDLFSSSMLFALSVLHIITIWDMLGSTSGSRTLNELMHLYTCTIYVAALVNCIREPSSSSRSILLCVYSGFANTRLAVLILGSLPTLVIQTVFGLVMAAMPNSDGFLGAILTAYMLGPALLQGKKAQGLKTFDIFHLYTFRLTLYHSKLGFVCRPMTPILIFFILLQLAEDSGLVTPWNLSLSARPILSMVLKKLKHLLGHKSQLHKVSKWAAIRALVKFCGLDSPVRNANAGPTPAYHDHEIPRLASLTTTVTYSRPMSRTFAKQKRTMSRLQTMPLIVEATC